MIFENQDFEPKLKLRNIESFVTLAIASLAVLWLGSCFIFWMLFRLVADFIASNHYTAVFQFYDRSIGLFAIAFWMSIATCLIAVHWTINFFIRRFSKSSSTESIAEQSNDFLRTTLRGSIYIFAMTFTGLLLDLNYRIAFYQDHLTAPSWTSLTPESKTYTSITGILTAPRYRNRKGKISDTRYFVIRFDDGTAWSTRNFPVKSDPDQIRQAVEFVSKQSNIVIRELPIIEQDRDHFIPTF